ncbi:hypothetical protein PV08_10820 [Exophiala spinifera]|uniref:Regulatory factor Sgt1 n=1 Tax=Exophiala spinifera TaxID=91928 RepID=A0A0D2BJS7_9EURO|nr:uncharacterized protein PV08_10820 [Exophiala spinifera]KIW11519.1 hypothetical protein PV08_10820 [Exophiala spinifera]
MPPTEEDIAWFRSTFHPIPKPALPDDTIEYSLYILSPSESENDSETRVRLRDVQKQATDLQRQYLKDYIWQRQGFSLELNKEDGLSLLRGRTEYGDSVEDEWVVVWLLRELTRKFNDLWVKVTDNDGEFLLIEASGTLPAWLEPEVAENRVWINNGQLKIVKPAANARSSRRTDEKLTLGQARDVLLREPKRIMHSASIEEEAFFRLRNYPAQIAENMHNAVITVPRKIAFLLHQKPAYVSPAVEAFYLRDPIALKPLQKKENHDSMVFPPEDAVTVSVRFPRVAYAQLKSQDFAAPAVFAGFMPSRTESKAFAQAETGMKVTCGFEMLVTDSQYQDRPAVREMKMLLDDLESGDESLPSDDEIKQWDKREDDEKWLDIDFNDLEKELDGQKGKKPGFGDKAAQENLQRIVKQFEDFLNDDKTGPDAEGLFGDDSDDDDLMDDDDDDEEGEDKEASFGEDEFTKIMQEMMGMPPEVMKEIMSGKLPADAHDPAARAKLRRPDEVPGRRVEEVVDDSDEDESEDMQAFMKQMERELRGSGALELGSAQAKQPAIKARGKDVKKPGQAVEDELSSDDDIDNEIDIDLARNLLESLRAQGGTAGPGSNLMSMMGFDRLHDDDDDDDDEVVAGPSRR